MTKLAPEVRLDLKRSMAAPIWPIRPVRPAQGRPKRPFLEFQKIHFSAKFYSSQTAQMCLLWVFGRFLAPKCPVFRILELSLGPAEIWPTTDFGPRGPILFLRVDSPKIPSPRRRSRWEYYMIQRKLIGRTLGRRNLSRKLRFLKISRFAL